MTNDLQINNLHFVLIALSLFYFHKYSTLAARAVCQQGICANLILTTNFY
jgi:hypothetical protein